MSFSFYFPTQLIVGVGTFSQLGKEASHLGRRALLVTGKGSLKKAGFLFQALEILKEASVDVVLFEGVKTNPTVNDVDAVGRLAKREGCDFVIGMGGGSCLDVAKMAALLAVHGDSCWDFINTPERPGRPIPAGVLPILAIPTTSGTGAEATPFAVVTNPDIPMKKGMGSPHLYPKVSIIDPEVLAHMPQDLTAWTGCDGVGMALESFISGKATPATISPAREALRWVIENLPLAYADGTNLQAREKVAWGVALSGMAVGHIDVNLAHAMSHPLSARYDLHHGLTVGLLTPIAMEFNLPSAPDQFAEVASLLTGPYDSPHTEAEAAKSVPAMKAFLEGLSIPLKMRDLGVPQQDIPVLAEEAMLIGAIRTNIRPVSYEDVVELYERAW